MSKESFCYKPKSLERGDKIGLVNPVGELLRTSMKKNEKSIEENKEKLKRR